MTTKTRYNSEHFPTHHEQRTDNSPRNPAHNDEYFPRQHERNTEDFPRHHEHSTENSPRQHERNTEHIPRQHEHITKHFPKHFDYNTEQFPMHLENNNNSTKMYPPKMSIHHGNVTDTNQYAADPFQCRLEIRTNRGEANFLRNLFSPLLEGIDPTFQFINLEEKDCLNQPLTEWDQDTESEYDNDGIVCPAISIVLFLSETFGQLSANSVQNYLASEPWKFHHRIELPKDVRPQITARQDFYQAFHEHPLWSICPVHYGNEHLRFHIVVKKFSSMRIFYERITGIKALDGSPGFCYIPIYSQTGLDIQLSLKCLPEVYPKPSTVARLRFKIPNIETILPYLVGCPLPMPNEKGTWLTNDPDGNIIILEETYPVVKGPRDTSDYESGSLETDSYSSSWESSKNVRQSDLL